MGTVYRARDLKHNRHVALKILTPELAPSATRTERFLREIRTTARLDHPFILPVLDSGVVAELLWYTMPYVQGEPLRNRLRRELQLPVEDAVHITRDVADALDYAHRTNLVHRDVKPDNILLSEGHARLADFGVAHAIEAAGVDPLTVSGIAVGTPAYMSPEQAIGVQELDGRSDLYSLGCVVFEMLAGEPPFTGPNVRAIIAHQAFDPVRSLRAVRGSVPGHVERAVMKVLEKVPADRFSTAKEFVRALSSSLGPEAAAVPPHKTQVGPTGPLDTAVMPTREPRFDEIDRSLVLALGVLTVTPLVYFLSFLLDLGPKLSTAVPGSEDFPVSQIVSRLNILFMALSFCLVGFYMFYLFRTNRVPSDKRAFWASVLLLANLVVMPAFWYRYVWPQSKARP